MCRPQVSPGFHRLADLRVFPDTACNRIANQPCGSLTQSGAGSSARWTALTWFSTALANAALAGRRLATAAYDSVTYVYVNDGADYVAPETRNFKTGVEALLDARCSTFLTQNGLAGARACSGQASRWYEASRGAGCYAGRLELAPTSEYRPIDAYISRFRPPNPPPLPPPKPPPPFPPAPPPPLPPPSPPFLVSLDAARDLATRIQTDFCDTCAAHARQLTPVTY